MKQTAMFLMIFTLVLVGAACSTTDDVVDAAEPGANPTVAESPASTTVTEPPETTTVAETEPGDGYECEQSGQTMQCKGIDYLTDNEGTWSMNVYFPMEGSGPWPLAIVYHGMTTQPSDFEAREIAELGAVAVAPQWLGSDYGKMTPEDYIDGHLFDRAACATGMAQAIAHEFGGMPQSTTVVGFSAGIHPAGWVGLGVVRDDKHCPEQITVAPTGLVLGDSQVIFHHGRWDDALDGRDGLPADTVDRFVNPERWSLGAGFEAYLWSTEALAESREVGEIDPTSWLHARNTTGTLIEDLETLGCLEDGRITFADGAVLLESRLAEFDFATVLSEQLGGGHSYKPEVYPRIAEVMYGELGG